MASVELCSDPDLNLTQSCSHLSRLNDGHTLCNATTRGSAPYHTCDCLAINPHNATGYDTILGIESWEARQASLQFAFSMLSLVFGAAYMLLFAVRPREMWRYPQSLAFWIYANDFVKSLSLAIVSGQLLRYQYKQRQRSQTLPFIVTWHSDCLCDADESNTHPGCACKGGVLALMLQAGLVGSVAFYFAMTHNFYCSVKDPFTKPQSRLRRYHVVCWSMVVLLSIEYLLPDVHGQAFLGSGYRAGYLACWFPLRVFEGTTSQDWVKIRVENYQIFFTLTLPIGLTFMITPVLWILARSELSFGGPRLMEMRAPRAKQLRNGDVLVRVFVGYTLMTGSTYFLSYATSQVGSAKGACENLEMGQALLLLSGEQGYDCYWAASLQMIFALLLALQGFINAVAGFYVNKELIPLCWQQLWRALHRLIRRGASNGPVSTSTSQTIQLQSLEAENDDISVSLRADIIHMTVEGIKQSLKEQSAQGDAPLAAPTRGSASAASVSSSGSEPPSIDPCVPARREHASLSGLSSSLSEPREMARPRSNSASLSLQLRSPLLASTTSQPSASDLSDFASPISSSTLPFSGGFAAGGAGSMAGLPSLRAGLSHTGSTRDGYFPLDEAFHAKKTIVLDEGDGEGGGVGTYCPRCGKGRKRTIFKEYAPRVFSWVRQDLFGVSSEDYIKSMEATAGTNQSQAQLSKFSEAKGGGFFFFSADQRYLIKTMTREEHDTLLLILKAYCLYLKSSHGRNSFIMRVSGCYSITTYGVTKYFFVQNNLFDPSTCAGNMHEIYDLKGSWVDRHVGHPRNEREKKRVVRKDTDWPVSRALRLDDTKKERLLRQAQHDARFLAKCRIMDYSLLLGIHIVIERRPAEVAGRMDRVPNSWAAQSFEGPGSYQVGIIDVLQRWNLRKRAERMLKIVFRCWCAPDMRNGMSAIEPMTYAKRFHAQFGTEQLRMRPELVKQDWDDVEREVMASGA